MYKFYPAFKYIIFSKADAATGTSDFEIDSSSSSSSTSTLRDFFLTPDETAILSYESVTSISADVKSNQQNLPEKERVSKQNVKYHSSTNTSSISSLNIIRFPTETKKDVALNTDILGINFTNSSLTSSSSKTEECAVNEGGQQSAAYSLQNVSFIMSTDSSQQFKGENEK